MVYYLVLALLLLLLGAVAWAWLEDRRRLVELLNGNQGEEQRRVDQVVLLAQQHETERKRIDDDRTALLSRVKRLEEQVEEYVRSGQRMVREINQRNERISQQEDALETAQRQRAAATRERDEWRNQAGEQGKRAAAGEERNGGLVKEVARLKHEIEVARAALAQATLTATEDQEEFDRLWSAVVGCNAELRAELHEIQVRCRRLLDNQPIPPAERDGSPGGAGKNLGDTVTSVDLTPPGDATGPAVVGSG